MYRIVLLLAFLLINSSLNAELNVKETLLKSGNPNVKLTVPSRCMFGDFDAIRYDAMYSKAPQVLLSITDVSSKKETVLPILSNIFTSIQGESKEDFKKKIREVESEYERLYKLGDVYSPKISKDGVFLLKICSDSSATGSCDNKQIKDVSEIIKAYQEPTSGYQPNDSVYFYQIFKIDKNKVSHFSKILKETEFDIFSKLLNDKDVFGEYRTVSSLPLKVVNGQIVIEAPRYDKKRCG